MENNIAQLFDKPSPIVVSGKSDDEIIQEFIRLDRQIKEMARERVEYQAALIQAAMAIQNGQATVHLETSDGKQKLKVEFKKEFGFDQSEIECAKDLLGDEAFNQIFSTKYTAKSRTLKTFLNTKSADERKETARNMIRETLTEIDRTPYISIERQ